MKEQSEDRVGFYIGKLLEQLADAYRRSKKDSGTNVIHRRTTLKPEKLYSKYSENSGDPAEIEALNEAAETCRELGFVNYQMRIFSNEIEKICLEDARIEGVEEYLKLHYGYESKQDKKEAVRKILEQYEGRSPAAESICQELREKLACNQIPAQYEKTEEVLRALVFVENNQTPLYLREASQMIYGSSKYFEEKTADLVCRRLRAYLKRPCGEDEMPSEILREYKIYPEQQRFCLKGDVTLKIHGTSIFLGSFAEGIEFAAEELADIETIQTTADQFITVENKTAYLRGRGEGKVFFYLGGYVNRTQRDFLKLVSRDNPDLKFLHFGDIDAGGLYIHEHLCRMTGIHFDRWHMSVDELADPRYQNCLQELTAQDRKRLGKLAKVKEYKEVAEYMLEQNVKLEQEIVSYHCCL